MKAETYIANALFEIGAVGIGQTPSGDEQERALQILQRLVDSKGAERLTIYELLRTVKTLTSGTRDYTLGSGGDIAIVRPLWIDHATFIQDSTVDDPYETPIRVYTDQEWTAIPQKTLESGVVFGVYFDHGLTSAAAIRGTLSTYPTIDVSNTQIALYTPKAVVGFVDLNVTDYAFPPGYEEAYHYEFAFRCCTPFGRPMPEALPGLREAAWTRIKNSNFRPTIVVPDSGLPQSRSGTWDVKTMQFR